MGSCQRPRRELNPKSKKIGYEKEEIGGGEGGKVEKRVGGKANTRQEQKGLE